MSLHLVRLRSRATRVARSVAAPHPREARLGAGQVAQALGAPVQARLTLGAPDDRQEREADAVAERVMRQPEGAAPIAVGAEAVQRKCAECEEEETLRRQADEEDEEQIRRQSDDEQKEEEIQRQSDDEQEEEIQAKGAPPGVGAVAADTAARIESARGRGRPLPASERQFFAPRLGADLAGVRVHEDGEAAQLNRRLGARAFTVGRDVFFGAGQFRPGTPGGRQLLAHELAHVLQQDRAGTIRRDIDWVNVNTKKQRIDLYLSLGIYGNRASSSLASKWKGNIESIWSRKLKFNDGEIDARLHVDSKAYPKLPDSQLSHVAIDESNAVFVEKKGFRSIVQYRCDWGLENWSCGRWAKDAAPMVVAHEAGHLMGLEDQYVDTPTGSKDKPGFEKDIMANFWNDNGKTEFTRAWLGAIFHYYLGTRS